MVNVNKHILPLLYIIIIILFVKQKPICSYKAELLGLHHLKYGL